MRPDDEVQAMRTLLQWNSENITMTAKMSGMGRNTVRKYRQGELPSAPLLKFLPFLMQAGDRKSVV